jgi:ATP-dependent Clp protease adaptor protein ClpS
LKHKTNQYKLVIKQKKKKNKMGLFDKKYEGDVLVDEKTDIGIGTDSSPKIVLYNDDFNSFDHVINCLVNICQHYRDQAEQCAYIVHSRGKCSVKDGAIEELIPICQALVDNGLDAKIEKV